MARPFAKQDPTLPEGFSLTFKRRFRSHVKKGSVPVHMPHLGECLLWTGHVNTRGYGVIGKGGRNSGVMAAHTAAFVLEHGRYPYPFCLHRCDNRACVNPSHLFEGTKDDNTQDMMAKGRGRFRVLHGSQNPIAKLDESKVLEILLAKDTNAACANRYGVCESAIRQIRARITWKHVSV